MCRHILNLSGIVKTAGKEEISHSAVFVFSCNFFWCIKKSENRQCKCRSDLLQLGCLIPKLEPSQILLVFFSSESCTSSCIVVELQKKNLGVICIILLCRWDYSVNLGGDTAGQSCKLLICVIGRSVVTRVRQLIRPIESYLQQKLNLGILATKKSPFTWVDVVQPLNIGWNLQ